MKYLYPKAVLLLSFIFFGAIQANSQAEKNEWKKISKEEISSELLTRKSEPNRAVFFELNLEELKNDLQNSQSDLILKFPNSQGQFENYKVKEASILAPELQEQFPNIRSYVGVAVDNPSQTIRFSVSPKGLHAMFFGLEGGTQFIDPYTIDNKNYIVYQKRELPVIDSDLMCLVEDSIESDKNTNLEDVNRLNDGNLRTYRLALACTGEYAQFHGGTVTDALAAMNTTMTRVNGIFEKELALRMVIVANNTQVIFTNPATDPFNGNNNANVLINESQTVIDSDFGTAGYGIGSANYDIGHTFSTGGGGLAQLNSPCVPGSKARGITGSSLPTGDSFDVDFVAHEIGHQFGANHTFNGSALNCGGGNRNNPTAYEPGSGSTIMAYAGICAPQNVQNNSDDYFHVVSLEEMWANISSGASSGCASTSSSGNNNSPTINSLTNYTIPKSTPFVLRGNGNDVDGNGTLTYCWEQKDNGITTYPLVSTATIGPAFRSVEPSSSPDRYMPALSTVLAGSTASTWEVLPSVARTMNFDLTVRDNIATGGRYTTEDMIVTFEDVTPFTVNSPNAVVNWAINSTQTITWEVGSTTNGTINCQNVNIKLSTDGGLTFPTTLASNTPNDGSQNVTIPNSLSTTCRIMVEAADNIFYDVSNSNFIISTSGGATEYCPSTYTNPGSEFISNVTFAGIDNDSGDASTNGYEDFTAISGNVVANSSYTFEVTIDTQGNFTDHCNVYIDWNQNLVFEGSELYDLGDVTNTSAGVLSTSISVPSDAINGNTRMRVLIEANEDPTGPCDDHVIEWGETEDYTLNITGGVGLSVDEETFEGFKLFPNPTSGILNISLILDSSKDVSVDLYDLLGKRIVSKTFTNNSFVFNEQLDYKNITQGIYIIKIAQENKSISKQIIIN